MSEENLLVNYSGQVTQVEADLSLHLVVLEVHGAGVGLHHPDQTFNLPQPPTSSCKRIADVRLE